jgi:transcriptional regulator with XRE-family HTH domain
MNSPKEKLTQLSSGNQSNWLKNAEYRIKNKWLSYSSQIARRILAAIEDREDLNQAKLADLLNVSPQQISKIVKGKENLTLETIYNLSQALQVELITFPEYKYNFKHEPVQLKNNTKSPFMYVVRPSQSKKPYASEGGLHLKTNNDNYYGSSNCK